METVTLERRDGELRITLNRPDALNAWNKQLGIDLLAAVREAADDDGVRAVVVTGAGRAFSSGADLRAGFDPTPEGHPDVETVLHERYHPIIAGLRELPKPVVAAVNGPAVGIGCSLALACDLIVARESAYFLLAFVNIGLVPDGGSSLLLPERVGLARATEMAMLGERIGARQALEWGLINRVTADDELDAVVDELAARLAAGPDARVRGDQAPVQRLAVHPDGGAAGPRGVDPAAVGGVGRLRGGRAGVPGEAAGRLLRPVSGRYPVSRPYTADAVGPDQQTNTRRRLRRLGAALPAVVLGALVLAPAASAGWFLPESAGSPNADAIRTLYILIALIGLVIFIGVEGLLIYSMFKFRARKGRVAAQIHGNTQLEIGWTVGAAAILIFLTVFTFLLLDDIKNPAASEIDAEGNPVAANVLYAATDQPAPPEGSASMNIKVIGEQYAWSFFYPEQEGEGTASSPTTTCTCRSG